MSSQSSAEGGSAFSNAAWWGRGWVSALSQVDTLRPALQLWYCGFDREWSHASPPSLTNPLSFQEAQSQPVSPAYRSYLTRPTRQSYKKKRKTETCSTPPLTVLRVLFSLSLLLSQFFRLCGLWLWHNPVFEKPSLRTLLTLCARGCVYASMYVHISLRTVLLSSSFDKLVKKAYSHDWE